MTNPMRQRIERAVQELTAAAENPKVGSDWWVLGRIEQVCDDLVRDYRVMCAETTLTETREAMQ